MTEQDPRRGTALAERYGTGSPVPRTALVAGTVALAAVFLAWVGWVAVAHGSPPVSSELVGFEVVDEHTATGVLRVSLEDGVRASCRLRAVAADHTVVGEQVFTPSDGTNEVTIRTEREATQVARVGCTAPGQPRPR